MAKSPVHDIDEHIGKRLKKLRQERKVSAAKLAELIGATQQQISRYENGQNKMGAGQLYQLARCLGVPISWFFLEYEISKSTPTSAAPKKNTFESARLDEEIDILRSNWHKLKSEQREVVLKLLDTFLF